MVIRASLFRVGFAMATTGLLAFLVAEEIHGPARTPDGGSTT